MEKRRPDVMEVSRNDGASDPLNEAFEAEEQEENDEDVSDLKASVLPKELVSEEKKAVLKEISRVKSDEFIADMETIFQSSYDPVCIDLTAFPEELSASEGLCLLRGVRRMIEILRGSKHARRESIIGTLSKITSLLERKSANDDHKEDFVYLFAKLKEQGGVPADILNAIADDDRAFVKFKNSFLAFPLHI